MASLASFVGAVLGIALISRILIWALGAWKTRSVPRLLLAHLATYLIAAIGSAYGQANGGPPRWEFGFSAYLLPSLLVAAFDIIGMLRPWRRNHQTPARDDANDPVWFIHVNGQERGPITTAAVRNALAQGTLSSEDWIWRNGLHNWIQIVSVDEFAEDEAGTALAATKANDISSNYLVRHWRGQLPLATSYWLNGIALVLLFVAIYVAISLVDITDYPRLISVAIICIWPLTVVAQTWLSVGIWRSAGRYSKVHPKRYWGGIAKLFTTLGWISALSAFVTQGLPQMGGFMEVISQASHQKRYALRSLRGDTELEINGALDFGLAREVEEFLKQYPSIKTIHLNSPGGRLAEADKLSSLILQKDLNTYVSISCASACVTVFAAGKERWLSKAAILGLHEPYFPGFEPAELRVMSESTRNFLISRGVNAEFVSRGLSVPHDSSWEPSHDELFRSGLATAYATDQNVAVSGIQAESVAEVERSLANFELYQVLRAQYPDEYGKVLETFMAGVQTGRSVAELRTQTWTIIFPLIEKSLPSASDDALLAFYRLAADEIEAFSKVSVVACEAFLKGDSEGFDFGALPADLQKRDTDAAAALLRTKGTYSGSKITEQQLNSVFAMINADALASGFDPAEFYKGVQLQLDAAKNCKAMLVFYRSILAAGSNERILALRYIAQLSAVQ